MQRINTALDRTWGYGCYRANIGSIVPCLSILKYLELCIQKFLRNKRSKKACRWQQYEEDNMHFTRILSSHFRSRWLSVKVKSKAVDGISSFSIKATLMRIWIRYMRTQTCLWWEVFNNRMGSIETTTSSPLFPWFSFNISLYQASWSSKSW